MEISPLRIMFCIATVIPLVLAGCADEDAGNLVAALPERTYTAESPGSLGWKSKGRFQSEFAGASSAEWGFLDGREVAFIVYPTAADARESGSAAGAAQTALTDAGTYALGVERTKCAGFGNYRTPYLLAPATEPPICILPAEERGGLGGSERCAMERVASLGAGQAGPRTGEAFDPQTVCPRRVPMYAEYAVEGNLVILCETKPSDGKAECAALAERLRSS